MIDAKTIIVVGDTFPTYTNTEFFTNGDIHSLFGERICQMFANADLSICNMEGALTDNPERCNKIGPVLVAPTNVITTYKNLGINCCTLANNHITDGGHQGIIDTMATLDNAGIQHIGVGHNEVDIKRSLIYNLGNLKVGLYNVCELMFNKPSSNKGGAWLYDEYIVCREIYELKHRCDYLIVVYHGGIERFRYPSPETRKRFHRMADNGADMILSQHTHCIGCEEWYNGAYLLYGQGNFLFRDLRPGQTDEALIVEIVFSDGRAEVNKHLVKSVDKKFVRYDEKQDLSAFESRSEKVVDETYVRQQFEDFCYQKISTYLWACRNRSIFLRIIRKILFPKSDLRNFWFKTYSMRSLMEILFNLRSEQKREEAIVGMEVLLDDILKNRIDVNWHEL